MARSQKTRSLIKARRRKIFARRLAVFARVLLVIVLFAAALWGVNYFYNSSYFKIKTLDINGNSHYSDEYINELLEGIQGENIFEVDKKEAEDLLTEDLVWIKTAELVKVFPDKIEIQLTERKPLLIIVYNRKYYLLDSDGMVLENLGTEIPEEYRELLEVTEAVDRSLQPGDIIAKKNILSCADIYTGFDDELKGIIRDAGIRDNVNGDIYFITTDGIEIVFGDSSQVIKKIEVLKLLLQEDEDYTIIDLRSPDNPAIK